MSFPQTNFVNGNIIVKRIDKAVLKNYNLPLTTKGFEHISCMLNTRCSNPAVTTGIHDP